MIVLYVGRELPDWELFALDSNGDPIDYSSGWTFSVAVRQSGTDTAVAATVTANANPTTNTGSSADVASLTIAPNAGELDNLEPGRATIIVVATSGGKDREHQYPVEVRT